MIPEPRSLPRCWVVIAMVHLVAGLFFLAPSYIRPDSVAIYSYLRSLTFDQDFLFLDEWAGFGLVRDHITLFKEITSHGTLANHWWIGTSILSSPFYLPAHGIATLVQTPQLRTDGFFGLYAATLAWTNVLFGLVTFILGRELAREGTPPHRFASLPVSLICLGTPWFYYAFRLPLGTHLAGAMLIGFICWLLFSVPGRERDSTPKSERGTGNDLLLGLAIGLAIVTRLQHVTLVPAIVFFLMSRGTTPKSWARIAAGSILPLMIQGAAWAAIYGNPLGPLGSGANLTRSTWLPFHHNHMAAVLFSSYHGLLIWSPIAAASMAGWLVELRGKSRAMGMTLLLMFAGEWVANGTFDRYFWGGFSFGPRRFSDLAVPLVIGLAWLLRRFPKSALIFSILATLWSVLLTHAAMRGMLDLAHDLSPAALVASVGNAFRVSAPALHSPITDTSLLIQSAVAILLIGVIVWLLIRIVRAGWQTRALLIFLATWFVFSILAIAPTRGRASGELTRFGIDVSRAGRFGPLVDQRTLLLDELAFYQRKGNLENAQRTAAEIQAIDELLRTLR